MPVYEYRCARCNKQFEVWQKITEEPVKVCPHCHGRKVERLISQTSFQLKGTGWYVTDYARGSSSSGKESETRGSKKKESSKDKGDSKPDAAASRQGASAAAAAA